MSTPQLYGQCAAPSVGALNNLVTTLIQAIFTAQCALSPSDYWPKDYGDVALKNGLDTYDFIVVGAGSAGSVVASRLSENPNWKILVLEAGGDPPIESEVPAFSSRMLHTKFTWNYFTEPNGRTSLATKNESCYWPRGKMIGGTGALNSNLYVRGNRKDYDGWLRKGNYKWGYDDVLPYFEKSIRAVGNDKHPQGYVVINKFDRFDVGIQDMVCDSTEELGVPRIDEIREGSEIGCLNLPGTIQNGRRMSTGKVHLGKVSRRSNLHVIKNAHVIKVNFDESGRKATSVTFVLRERHTMTAHIGREVVLSAGTINSAKLLLLSGIGPRRHLENLKIPVIHQLAIGHNLQDHVSVPVFIEINNYESRQVTAQERLDGTYNYLLHLQSYLVQQGTASLTSFLNANISSSSRYPDIEKHYMFFQRGNLATLDGLGIAFSISDQFLDELRKILKRAHLMAVVTVLAHPKSHGKMRLRSANFRDPPKIVPNYLHHADDVETLLGGIHFLMRSEKTAAFLAKQAFITHVPIAECDKYVFKSDPYWRCYMKYFSITAYHPTSTVKMGPVGDETACVDPRLRLHGVENVRVADASIMPDVISANTNAAAIMIGERGADFIKEDWAQVADN